MPHRRFRSRHVRMEADMASLRPEADMANLSQLLHDALRDAGLPPSLASIIMQGTYALRAARDRPLGKETTDRGGGGGGGPRCGGPPPPHRCKTPPAPPPPRPPDV
jgi:hypothetical protein